MTDRIGQTFGNYQLIQFLGRGGFADVYLGKHYHLGTETAIKILHTHLQVSDESSFLTEARTIASLEHSNIVRILDFDIQEGIPFLVMSYASNGTSRHRHPKGTRLPASLVGEYVKPLASALQYAHDQKIIHRDIKPENILIGRNNEPLLTDFGLAITAQSTHLQSTQKVVGTAYYMAPEQFQGKPRFASDQYSLAVVIYEWLTGERPFQGSFIELYSQHLSAPPPSIREKVPTVSLDLERVIHIAMSKDPLLRFGSIRAFATAFEQALCLPASVPDIDSSPTEPISPSSYTIPTPPSQPPSFTTVVQADTPETPVSSSYRPLEESDPTAPRKRRTIPRRLVITGMVLTVAGGIGIWSYATFGRSNPEIVKPGRGKLVYTHKDHSDWINALAWSPDGKRIASASIDDTVQIWNATDGGLPYTYNGHAYSISVNALAWSPDGSMIASGGDDGDVLVWNITDGSSVSTFKSHIGAVYAVAWSPDGTMIASGGDDRTVQLWNAADGRPIYTYKGHSSTINTLAWSPGGGRIASGGADYTVQVWNATDGKPVYTYPDHTNFVNALAWSPDGKRIASGSADGTVQIWNATSGKSPYVYKGHPGGVNALAWSPNGTMIASGSADKTAQVWNATDGKSAYAYKGHTGAVYAVAWSIDSTMIASGGDDGEVHVWNAI